MPASPVEATRHGRWWLPLVVAVAVIGIDQTTKSIAEAHLSSSPTHLWGPFGFELTYNPGSAFSLLQGSTGPLIILDLALVAVLAVVGMRAHSWVIQLGIGMMLGGAIGNLADRIVRHHHGGVIDFITLSHWPTFNAADAAVTLGAMLVAASLLSDMLRRDDELSA